MNPRRLLCLLLPDLPLSNPLVRYRLRRVQWWRVSVGHDSLLIACWLIVLLLVQGVGAVLMAFGNIRGPVAGIALIGNHAMIGNFTTGLNLLLFGSVVAGFGLDFIIVTVTLYDLLSNRDAFRGDLLYMTPIAAVTIARAQYSLAQLRVWWLVVILAGVRVGWLVLWLLLWALVAPILLNEPVGLLMGLSSGPGVASLQVGASAVAILFLVVEPFLRVRSLTALALSINNRFSTIANGLVGGVLLTMLVVTLPQLIFLYVYNGLLNGLVRLFRQPGLVYAGAWFVLSLIFVVGYVALQTTAFHRAVNHVFPEGRN